MNPTKLFLAPRVVVVALVVLPVVVAAQDKPVPPERKEPETTKFEVVAPPPQSQLPKFDVPEFVITGIESIDLPNVNKDAAQVEPSREYPTVKSSFVAKRDRETVEFTTRRRMSAQTDELAGYSGRAEGSIGTFSLAHANVWYGRTMENAHYLVHGGYERLMGFAPQTDRSGGSLGAVGALTIVSPQWWLNNARLGSDIGFRTSSYKLYGSVSPSFARTKTDFHFEPTLDQSGSERFPFWISAGVGTTSFNDSAVTATQTRIALTAGAKFAIAGFPVSTSATLRVGSLTSGNSGTVTLFDVGAASERYRFNQVFVQGQLHLYLASGMEDQRLTRLYPTISAGLQVSPTQSVVASFNPQIDFGDLGVLAEANPYLSTSVRLKNRDMSSAGELSLNSIWSEAIRTKVGVSVEAINDYPMFVDSSGTGQWDIVYTGKTTVARFRAEMFAKFHPNDYFAAGLGLTSSKNSTTGEQVPYLPSIDLVVSLLHKFSNEFAIGTKIKAVQGRTDDIAGSNAMPAVFLIDADVTYAATEAVQATVKIQNLTNQAYELWKGYQELPLTLSVGINVQW